jgi:hypothetical protein
VDGSFTTPLGRRHHDGAVLAPVFYDTATVLGLICAIAAAVGGDVGPAVLLVALSAVAAYGAARSRRERGG